MGFTYELLLTADGSHTVHWLEKDVTFHSHHGALTESRHVFITHGLEYLLEQANGPITIFEMGFGTGLNALLAYGSSEQARRHISYYTIEAHPLPDEILSALNYPALLGVDPTFFQHFHRSSNDQPIPVSDQFTLYKTQGQIEDFCHQSSYDLVFYDAFGPGAQPHLWQESVLSALHEAMNPGGALVTFCAQGAFKRTLKKIGFHTEALPGPPGKREMTRAIKL